MLVARRIRSRHGAAALGAVLLLLLLGSSFGTDPEADLLTGPDREICSEPEIIECSNWDDGQFDGWVLSPGGEGNIFSGAGLRGSSGWLITINRGSHGTLFFDKKLERGQIAHGPLHVRFYVKFSRDYLHIPACGLQKMMYLESTNTPQYWRVMLGIQPARFLGEGFAALPETVGVFGFDYIGHRIELPNRPGDNPILIYPERWYCVEISAHWTSREKNSVSVWVDGILQMSRRDHDDGVWTPGHLFSAVQDSSHYGGNSPECLPVQTQFVFKDQHIISTSYIGPIESGAESD